jgi:peptidoglycan hydrolase-like protein with peptidoglycan-binding domain
MLTRSLPLALLAVLCVTAQATAAPAPCGSATKRVQRALNAAGYPAGAEDGCPGSATRSGVQAFQLAQRLAPDGVAGPLTLRALRAPRRVRPFATSPPAHVEVDLARQLLLVVRNRAVKAVYAASSGRAGYGTPRGSFVVSYQQPRSWSHEYDTWLPWASYFIAARGIAVHGGKTPPRPDSHGCVRVPEPHAAAVYGAMAPGTTVIVH